MHVQWEGTEGKLIPAERTVHTKSPVLEGAWGGQGLSESMAIAKSQ